VKTLILNSGAGIRMGAITDTQPKCMTKLITGETILGRQLRQLTEVGIKDVVITTGYYDKAIRDYCSLLDIGMRCSFVKSELYATTNYIYSMYLAGDFVNDDLLLMHGDMVFETQVLCKILDQNESCMIVSQDTTPLPQKDFKAVIENEKIIKIGIEFFTNAAAAQPIYKLKRADWHIWLDGIKKYCETGRTKCYAEDAFNTLETPFLLRPFDVGRLLCSEVDTMEDLTDVNLKLKKVEFGEQSVLEGADSLENILMTLKIKKLFVVHDKSFSKLDISHTIEKQSFSIVKFSNFSVNPRYEEVCNAAHVFRNSDCDAIIAIGGGSVIDVAKCAKLFAGLSQEDYLTPDKYNDSGIPFIAVPSTSGTGSESTRFAVAYKNNEKLSITHNSLLPNYAVLVPEILDTLPLYQKKCTFLDALCQAIESWWCINSTEESVDYSRRVIELLLKSYEAYLKGDNSVNHDMLLGANYSGKAINITQTTAPHALSYKLTSVFNLPHGHSVAICLPSVWQCMLDNTDKTCDIRGVNHVTATFSDIAIAMGYGSPVEAIAGFSEILKKLEITPPTEVSSEVITELTDSVNQKRLKNSPVAFNAEMIRQVYESVLRY